MTKPPTHPGPICVVIALLTIGTSRLLAQEQHQAFIDALAARGHYDLALHYLEGQARRGSLPQELADSIELTRGKLKSAQAEVSDPETKLRLLNSAAEHFAAFLSNSPEPSAAEDARSELAMIQLKLGQYLLGKWDSEKDEATRTRLLAQARAKLETAESQLSNVTEAIGQRLIALRAELKERDSKAKRAAANEAEYRQSLLRLNRGVTHYFLARTFVDPADSEKKAEQINQAINQFEELFQQYRGRGFVWLMALLWQARTIEERAQGSDLRDALDRYDEVLANQPEPGSQLALERGSFFAQAQAFRAQVLMKLDRTDEAIQDILEWLQVHDKMRYATLVKLELAKALAKQYESLEGNDRRNGFRDVMSLLDQVARRPSKHQMDAIRLRHQYASEVRNPGGKIDSFSEAMFFGEAAIANERWSDAVTAYQQALTMAGSSRTVDEEQRDRARYYLCYSFYKAGEIPSAVKQAEDFVKENPRSKMAPEAAGLALVARTALLKTARNTQQRQGVISDLVSLAERIEKNWPGHSQADQARRTLGNLLLYQRQYRAAAEAFGRVAEQSPNYVDSQLRAGNAYWSAYLNSPNKASQEAVELARRAETLLGAVAQAAAAAGSALVHAETSLVLAQIALATSRPQRATELLDPFLRQPDVIAALAERDKLQLYSVAMEARIAQNQLDAAIDLVSKIDTSNAKSANRVALLLVKLGTGLEQRIESLDASGKQAELQAVRDSYRNFLDKVFAQDELPATVLQYVADSYYSLESYRKAVDAYNKLLPLIAAANRGQRARVELRRIASLRFAGEFERAIEAIDAVLAEGKYLQAVVERCRIQQQWGEESKDADRLNQAIRSWYTLSRQLEARRPKPLEYFEAKLGMARCYLSLGDKAKASRWIKSTKARNPELGSPEMKARFEALLKEVEAQ